MQDLFVSKKWSPLGGRTEQSKGVSVTTVGIEGVGVVSCAHSEESMSGSGCAFGAVVDLHRRMADCVRQ